MWYSMLTARAYKGNKNSRQQNATTVSAKSSCRKTRFDALQDKKETKVAGTIWPDVITLNKAHMRTQNTYQSVCPARAEPDISVCCEASGPAGSALRVVSAREPFLCFAKGSKAYGVTQRVLGTRGSSSVPTDVLKSSSMLENLC